jgi:RHS repeat-associated protein
MNLIAEQTIHESPSIGEMNPNTINYYVWGLDISGSFQKAGGIGGLAAVHLSHVPIEGGAEQYSVYTPCYDANGNITEYTDTNGVVVAHYEYSPFGQTLNQYGTMSEAFPFRFSTKYRNNESDLYNYSYRFFAPALGRWMNRDPLGEPGGENLYSYVGNCPLSERDPFGLKKSKDEQEKRCCCGTQVFVPNNKCCINGGVYPEKECVIRIYVGHSSITMGLCAAKQEFSRGAERVGVVCCNQRDRSALIPSLISFENDKRTNCYLFPDYDGDGKEDITRGKPDPETKLIDPWLKPDDNIINPVPVATVYQGVLDEVAAATKEASNLCSIGGTTNNGDYPYDSKSPSSGTSNKRQSCCKNVKITLVGVDHDRDSQIFLEMFYNTSGPLDVADIPCKLPEGKEELCSKRGGAFTAKNQ